MERANIQAQKQQICKVALSIMVVHAFVNDFSTSKLIEVLNCKQVSWL